MFLCSYIHNVCSLILVLNKIFTGKEYGIVVSVENLPANASISSILLVAEKGTSVTSLNASLLSVEPRLEYFAKTAITTQVCGFT